MAPGRIGEHDRRWIIATPATIIAGQRPEVAGLGFTRPGVQHRRAGVLRGLRGPTGATVPCELHEEPAGSFEVRQHPVDDRCQMIGRRAAPACQGRAVQIDTAPAIYLALAVKRQLIGVRGLTRPRWGHGPASLGHGHMGERAFGGQSAFNQPVRRLGLANASIATAAGIAGANRDDDLEVGGNDVQPFGVRHWA